MVFLNIMVNKHLDTVPRLYALDCPIPESLEKVQTLPTTSPVWRYASIMRSTDVPTMKRAVDHSNDDIWAYNLHMYIVKEITITVLIQKMQNILYEIKGIISFSLEAVWQIIVLFSPL